MLAHRLRRWRSIKPTMVQRLVFSIHHIGIVPLLSVDIMILVVEETTRFLRLSLPGPQSWLLWVLMVVMTTAGRVPQLLLGIFVSRTGCNR